MKNNGTLSNIQAKQDKQKEWQHCNIQQIYAFKRNATSHTHNEIQMTL